MDDGTPLPPLHYCSVYLVSTLNHRGPVLSWKDTQTHKQWHPDIFVLLFQTSNILSNIPPFVVVILIGEDRCAAHTHMQFLGDCASG